jgi:pimeloyl-ACP methyl ester carboxylesterase
MDRIGRTAALVVIATGVFGLASAETARLSPAAAWYADYRRDSRLVRLPHGRALNLYCEGRGWPTVVLESGIGESAFTWWKVQDRIARVARVCAYDRAGLGASPAGPLPRDTRAEVKDLEAVLPAAGVGPPYVLVGHSMGGYNARLFAFRNPRQVAGLVLVDPSVEDQVPILEKAAPEGAKHDANAIAYSHACADPHRSPETAARCARPAPQDFPPELAATWNARQTLATSQTFASEVESFLTADSAEVAAARRPLGAMPLIVLTRGDLSSDLPRDQAQAEWTLWKAMHDTVARLSTVGENRIVPGAGHYIQIDRPEAVVDAVYEVVGAARRRR